MVSNIIVLIILLLFIHISQSTVVLENYFLQPIYAFKNSTTCNGVSGVIYISTNDTISSIQLNQTSFITPYTNLSPGFYVAKGVFTLPIGNSSQSVFVNNIEIAQISYMCENVPGFTIKPILTDSIPKYQYLLKDIIAFKIDNLEKPLSPTIPLQCHAYGVGGTYKLTQTYDLGSVHYSVFQFNMRPNGQVGISPYNLNTTHFTVLCNIGAKNYATLPFKSLFSNIENNQVMNITNYPLNNGSGLPIYYSIIETSNSQVPFIHSFTPDYLNCGFYLPVIQNISHTTFYSRCKFLVGPANLFNIFRYNDFSGSIDAAFYTFNLPTSAQTWTDPPTTIFSDDNIYLKIEGSNVNYNVYSPFSPKKYIHFGIHQSLEFPYGVISGVATNLQYQLHQYIPKQLIQGKVMISSYPNDYPLNYYSSLTVFDQSPPFLLSFKAQNYNEGRNVVSIIVQDQSYISWIKLPYYVEDSFLTLGSQHIVKIEESNLIITTYFEVIVPKNALNTGNIYISDICGNILNFNTLPGMPVIDSISELFLKNYPLNFDLIENLLVFSFSKNDIHTFDQSVNVILYINYQGSTPFDFVSIVSCLNMKTDSKSSFYDYGEQCRYNSTLSLFSCPILIPKRTTTSSYCFYIWANGFYSSTTFALYRGSDAELRTFSQSSYQLPPIVSGISPINVADKIGFIIDVESENPIQSLEYHLVGVYDSVGYKFTITNSDNSTSFNLTRPIEFNQCRTQSYYIRSLTIYDEYGYYSTTNSLEGGTYQVDPLYRFRDAIPISTLTCAGTPVDNIPPTIINFSISTSYEINVGGNQSERTISFSFKTSDETELDTSRYIPKVYFESMNERSLLASLDGVPNPAEKSAFYNGSIILPFGFGYRQIIYVSIYGVSDSYNNFIGSTGIFNFTAKFDNAPLIQETDVLSSFGGTLTIRGKKFLDVSSVYFNYNDGNPFVKMNSISSLIGSRIIVYDIQSINSSTFQVYVAGDEFSSNIYTGYVRNDSISPVPTTFSQCQGSPLCGGPSKGICTDFGCVCKEGYVSSDCSSQIVIINPPINTTDPSFYINPTTDSISISLSTLISLVSVSEITPKGTKIFHKVFDQWIFSNVTSNPNKSEYKYYLNFTKDFTTTHLTVNVTFFSKYDVIDFAGEKIPMNPSTLKYTIYMTPFSFKSPLNHLEFEFSSTLMSNSEDPCSTNFESGQNQDQFEYSKISINEYSIYCKVTKVGLVDNRPTLLSNKVSQKKSNTREISSSLLISVPSYSSTIYLDPDFSLLTEISSDKYVTGCNSNSKKLSKGQLAGIIIGSIAFGIVIIILIFVLLKKKLAYSRIAMKFRSIKLKM